MLVDMHCHSKGISRCCKVPIEDILERTKQAGIDAIILTNHYIKDYVANDDSLDFAKKYINEYLYAKTLEEKYNCKVFFGIELTVEFARAVHLLIYGVPTDFVLKHHDIYNYSLEKIYSIVKQAGGILIQAHPFRNNCSVLDVNFLDGVEINCHPIYKFSHSDELLKIGKDNNLLVTVGGDYHADTYRPLCGVNFPDSVKDCFDIKDYLLAAKELKLTFQEPDSGVVKRDVVYKISQN